MAQNKQAIKSRIRSTQATMKITRAMELMANSKLQKQRLMMEKNREYASVLASTLQQILAQSEQVENVYMKPSVSSKTLAIVFSSDLGLCGGYNINMLRQASEYITKDDLIYVIGSKGFRYFKSRGYNVLNETVIDSEDNPIGMSNQIIDEALKLYLKSEIGKIQVFYTEFKNTISFVPTQQVLLPVEKKDDVDDLGQELLFEPNPSVILDTLIPMSMKSILYSLWMQTKTSEQGSRRVAMESATDNAEELEEKLVLQFNQARQAAITQEVTEIVSGSDSL